MNVRTRKPTKTTKRRTGKVLQTVRKVPSGIAGLDQVTAGGLPFGRATLVCGGAGCGKTLFGIEFLVRGALLHDEAGVFVAFEETEAELTSNVGALGFDLADLVARKLLSIDYIKIDRSEIEETGEYDLDGLFVRLAHAIESVGAKRVVLDTVEALFGGLKNEGVLRSELRRLFRWLKDRGVTVLITGEKGEGTLTRYGLEEYVSDCVITLDNRVTDQVSTRRLRVVKYRGSSHGSNEYPFLIDEQGISVLPVTSLGLDYPVSKQRVPTGVSALDDMLEGGGYFRASTVLVSGTAGTGKTSLAAMFADATCRRGERVVYLALEESTAQVTRNMSSIGLDLKRWQHKKLLHFQAARPTVFGLEMHLVAIRHAVDRFQPRAVIIDPVSSLITAGNVHEVKSMMVRLFDYLKMNAITCLVTSLSAVEGPEERTVGLSSLVDTWIQVRDIEIAAERTRGLYLVKSRGMGHSNQVRELVITSKGLDLLPVAIGRDGVLTGSARSSLEADQRARAESRKQQVRQTHRTLERRREALEARIGTLRAELATEEEEVRALLADGQAREVAIEGRDLRRAAERTAIRASGRRT